MEGDGKQVAVLVKRVRYTPLVRHHIRSVEVGVLLIGVNRSPYRRRVAILVISVAVLCQGFPEVAFCHACISLISFSWADTIASASFRIAGSLPLASSNRAMSIAPW